MLYLSPIRKSNFNFAYLACIIFAAHGKRNKQFPGIDSTL